MTENISDTELSILEAILLLRSTLGKKKLSVTHVAKEAKLSRNAIYKYYYDLLPVIVDGADTEKFKFVPKNKLLEIDAIRNSKLVSDLDKKELSRLKEKFEKENLLFREQILGEYMQNLLVSDNVKIIEHEMLSMQSQLSERINDNKNLRLDKSKLTAELVKLKEELETYRAIGGGRVTRKLFSPDYRSAKEQFDLSNDFSEWLSAKKTISKLTILQAIDYSTDSDAFVLILTQYNINPELVMQQHLLPEGKYTYACINIATSAERKRLISEIKESTGLPVHGIFAQNSNTQAKWFRQTYKQFVPLEEIISIENHWQMPSISEGYSNLLIMNTLTNNQ